jgi:hypothetical protein
MTTSKTAQPSNILKTAINGSMILTRGWCTANCMKLDVSKTKVTSYYRNSEVLTSDYELCQSPITRTASIKDMGCSLIPKFIYITTSNIFFTLCKDVLLRSITFTLSSLKCMHLVYFTFARYKDVYCPSLNCVNRCQQPGTHQAEVWSPLF